MGMLLSSGPMSADTPHVLSQADAIDNGQDSACSSGSFIDTVAASTLPVFCSAGEPCSVCHDEFVAGAEVMQLPCRHCFHESCLLPWLSEVRQSPACLLSGHALAPNSVCLAKDC